MNEKGGREKGDGEKEGVIGKRKKVNEKGGRGKVDGEKEEG